MSGVTSYVRKSTKDKDLDALRNLVLAMFQMEGVTSLKKNEIVKGAAEAEINFSQSNYSKVLREIAVSDKAALWTFKKPQLPPQAI